MTALVGTLVQEYKSDDASTTLLEFKSGAQATVDCFYCIPDEASRRVGQSVAAASLPCIG